MARSKTQPSETADIISIDEKGQFTMCSQYKCAVCILKNDLSFANLKRTSCWQFDVWPNDLLNQQISFDCKTIVDLIL